MAFPPCLSRKRPFHGLGSRSRWPFPPACRGKGRLMLLSWTWCAFAMAFPPCLSRKRPFHGLGSRLRWPFPPACRGKDRLMDFVRICDGLFPLPVEEKAVSWTLLPLCDCLFPLREKEKASFRFPRRHPREASRGPRKWPGSSRAKKLSILTIFAS